MPLLRREKLYSVWQRYNFESNLQPFAFNSSIVSGCIQYDKDTILKAIYNTIKSDISTNLLYSVWQRYNFESNLQLVLWLFVIGVCCIQYDKDTILKAIYNKLFVALRLHKAVFSMTKIQFWKQFTTIIDN